MGQGKGVLTLNIGCGAVQSFHQFLIRYDHVSNLPTLNSYSEQHGLRMTEI